MANLHTCLTSLVIMRIRIKAAMKRHFISTKMKTGREGGKKEGCGVAQHYIKKQEFAKIWTK